MIVAFRELHGPVCQGNLRDLDRKLHVVQARGVAVIAISADTRERAAQRRQEWELERLPTGGAARRRRPRAAHEGSRTSRKPMRAG